jgi:hypothetical protein
VLFLFGLCVLFLRTAEAPKLVKLQTLTGQIAEVFILILAAYFADLNWQTCYCFLCHASNALSGADRITVNQASDDLCAFGSSQPIHEKY